MGLVGLVLTLGASAQSKNEEAQRSKFKVQLVACGALLRDDFNSGVINKCFWRLWQMIPVSVSRSTPGISPQPGFHAVSVHLCGVYPDTYPEGLYGKMEGEATRRIVARCDTPYPDARGWFFAVVNQNVDNRYLVSGTPFAELGDEQRNFHDVLVDYDGTTRLARGFLKDGEQWIQLGKAEPLIRGITQIELKIIDATPLGGAYREARFDDCRLYPNPRMPRRERRKCCRPS